MIQSCTEIHSDTKQMLSHTSFHRQIHFTLIRPALIHQTQLIRFRLGFNQADFMLQDTTHTAMLTQCPMQTAAISQFFLNDLLNKYIITSQSQREQNVAQVYNQFSQKK